MKKVLILLVLLGIPGCAVRKVTVPFPTRLTFENETYAVIQTSPDSYTILTRSKAAIEEIATRLGCDKQHICASEWDGEVFRIQRMK